MARAPRRTSRFGLGGLAVWLSAVASCGLHALKAQDPIAEQQSSAAESIDDDDDRDNPYRSGLIARYAGSERTECVRLDAQVANSWGDDPPDRRIARGAFSARFSGHLLVQTPGVYRLRVFAAGSVRLQLNGKLLIDDSSREPGWLDGQAIELPFGYHLIAIDYRRATEPARLALFWEGPQFQLEPIDQRWLFHEADKTPPALFEQGEQLVRALRCSACHALPGEARPLPAAALDGLAGNLARDWLVEWLAQPPHGGPTAVETIRPLRRMPHFGIDRQQAGLMADYLLSGPEPAFHPPEILPEPKAKKKAAQHAPSETPSDVAGGTLFRTIGCLACHRVGELGTDGLFGGADLSAVARKRPASFFAKWLADSGQLNRDHRMPVFALTSLEIQHLAAYLQTLGRPAERDKFSRRADASGGRNLVEQFHCDRCHTLPQTPTAAPAKRLIPIEVNALESADGTCLGEPDPAKHRPGYRMGGQQRQAIATFIAGAGNSRGETVAERGQTLLVERNCLACHARGASRGLGYRLAEIGQADPSLREVLAALSPPALDGVGDKLHDDALKASITVSQPPRQNWLRVRMPRFPLSADDTNLLARHFIDSDRVPERPDEARPIDSPSLADGIAETAGARLVTADGFGCTSCHAIGRWKPQKVALNAAGANLSLLGKRIRRSWFDRFVRNPARSVPRMEMPAVQASARGVLDGSLDRQLAAVWQVLNREGFTPPSPNALRVVRRANQPGLVESAAVLTEVIEIDGQPFVKPLVIGLANRHNLLMDLSAGRLAAWWLGDTARQQTRGKSWHWEAGAPQLLTLGKKGISPINGEISLIRAGSKISPARIGDYVTEFDWFEQVAGGVRFSHRLHFSLDEQPVVLMVRQQFCSLPSAEADERTGFRRRVEIDGLAENQQVELVALSGELSIDESGRLATQVGRLGRVTVSLRSPSTARFAKQAQGAAVLVRESRGRGVVCELDYREDLPPDEFTPRPEPLRSATLQELTVVPGFEAVRLPVTDSVMPTGLAWRGDGTLIVSSLEGRVWLGRDSDGDGLEDRLVVFSDELAAPYGVAATGDAIDVINKYALLRLYDRDGDGHADRTERIASGWGHTLDYHDWAVGLPRDRQGNYYVSFPCQQDDRSEAGAALRGAVVRLAPREPSGGDPRRFAIVELAAGLRFPQGIALSRAGDLFVTDNQGNYTPFNELNHIVVGARYGFINRLESQRGLNSPFRPAAIEIPHPWTRSVNGICFLETPANASAPARDKFFGPFEGHLVGCEYDTRRLVRMSLDRVGNDFQGAVYPLSVEPAPGLETFEGPLVCQVAPNGDLYVGNIRDSGWGAGSNTGSLVRLRPRGEPPCGIAEVRADRHGFSIDFTRPVDRDLAGDPANYSVSSYRRIATPDYGGADRDRRVDKVKSARLSEDARGVTLEIDEVREGFVYEFHLRDLAPGQLFFPAEAYYTLRHRIP